MSRISSMIDTLASRLSHGLVCTSDDRGARMPVEVVRETRAEGGYIAHITIDRAAKLNALDRGLMAEIIAAMTGLADDPALRLAIVTGAGGRAFIGGADIDELSALDAGSARGFITAVHVCCDAFRHLPVPAVAR